MDLYGLMFWRMLRAYGTALALAVSMPWQVAHGGCLGLGSVLMEMRLSLGYCMPWLWLHAHVAALALVACP